MFWLTAAAMALSPAPEPASPPAVRAQALAVVRIVAGVRLKLDADHNEGAPRPRNTVVASNGTLQPARLIEFQ